MRFEFDTAHLSPIEITATIAMLQVLQSSQGAAPRAAVQATVTDNGASGTPVLPSPADATGDSSAKTGAPTDEVEGAPGSVKRTRRTKAQIEADNLAAEALARAGNPQTTTLTQDQQDAVDDTAGILTKDQKANIGQAVAGTADATISISAEQVAKVVELDALRTALQTYTANHDLAAGITLLGSFECKRISDVLALPAEKQQAFLLACNV